MERKVALIRMPKELHTGLKEAVAYLGTDMTAFVNDLVEKEVSKVLNQRDKERTQS